MFQMLHRVYVLGWTVLVGGAAWLYPRTGLSEPLIDCYEVWQNSREAHATPLGHLEGKVVDVPGPTTVIVRTPDHQLYSIGLVGLTVPRGTAQRQNDSLAAAESAKSHLSELVLSNDVAVGLVSIDPQRRGLGVLRLGTTNINSVLIQSGVVELKHEFIRGLSFREQYTLIHAERMATGNGRSSSAP
jgi:hypothetical protein